MTKAMLFGDSLMVGSSRYIRKIFTGWDYEEVSKVGIRMGAALDMLSSDYDETKGLLNTFDIWFISLGTNDWYTRYHEFVQTVNDVRWLAGDATIIWSTIHRPLERGSYRRWNNYLRLRRDPHFAPADWAAYVEENPSTVGVDKIHPLNYNYLGRLFTDQATKLGFKN
jgi:hypothetical protein